MNKWDLMLQNELKKQPIELYQFVQRCCVDLPVKAQQVIDNMLSANDEKDIINGVVSAESLRLYIEVWISTGKPYYSKKKPG